MTVTVHEIGKMPNGEIAEQIVIENKNGHKIGVTNWGATWQFFKTNDNQDLMVGLHTTDKLWEQAYSVGDVIGRVGNRITGAKFTLNGKTYHLKDNELGNALHGGKDNFSNRMWDYTIDQATNSVTFTTAMTEEIDHFPGTMPTSVTYTFSDDDEVSLTFSAESDEDTLFNPTSHGYFNPAGIDTDARDLNLQIHSQRRLELRPEDTTPTGNFLDNANTPFDFNKPTRIGDNLAKLDGPYDVKFDNAFEINQVAGRPAAVVSDPKSGRSIEVYSDRNAIIFFIADPEVAYHEGDREWFDKHPYNAIALEAQTLSDAINHEGFGDIVLPAGKKQTYRTVYKFKNLD
ncbi:aldose epimerase family protein [Weissella paramesenteroides]|uniref:aldose epimerase family protein n=1 Tax=Weissella paramesenteroides TaxID=1249 RepID=UPI002E7C13F4|nr:aldose epimerase family protein [Weissella paramesenteroides]WPQ68449.1 aldose epimerase family protein [Weissella paramesenteroides]